MCSYIFNAAMPETGTDDMSVPLYVRLTPLSPENEGKEEGTEEGREECRDDGREEEIEGMEEAVFGRNRGGDDGDKDEEEDGKEGADNSLFIEECRLTSLPSLISSLSFLLFS